MKVLTNMQTTRVGIRIVTWLVMAATASSVDAQPSGADSLDDLLMRRGAALKQTVASLQRQLRQVEARTVPLEQEIDRLMEAVEAIEIPSPEAEVDTEDEGELPPREVEFRPPLLRETDKDTPLAVVCRNGRAAILDIDQSNSAMEAILESPSRLDAFVEAQGGELDAGDFHLKVTLLVVGNNVLLQRKVVPKPGRQGEAADEVLHPSSRLNARLRGVDPQKTVVQFAVYPDSFDLFRSIRKMLWTHGFAINWFPIGHNEEFGVGGGSVHVQ